MSWDATLIDDRGHVEGDWNYTHNCNRMADAVLDGTDLRIGALRWWGRHNRQDVIDAIVADPTRTGSWWQFLDRMTGPTGAALLDAIIRRFDGDPDRFRAMNPENGWGDFDSFRGVLVEMRDRVPEWPTVWEVSG